MTLQSAITRQKTAESGDQTMMSIINRYLERMTEDQLRTVLTFLCHFTI